MAAQFIANEVAPRAGTQVVNGVCNQLFACTRLAVKQDGCIRWRNNADLFQYVPNGRALADDPFEAVTCSSLIPEIAVRLRFPSLRESLLLRPSRIRESNARVAHIILLPIRHSSYGVAA